jgi:hypothetical protein
MSLEVRWTEEAEFTFDHIVSFIQQYWGERPADRYKTDFSFLRSFPRQDHACVLLGQQTRPIILLD